MKSWRLSRLIVRYVFCIASFLAVDLWAELDMYVYNVGQANCILVTADIIGSDNEPTGQKNAIFFDTGAQKPDDFKNVDCLVKKHIDEIIKNKINTVENVWFVLTHTDDDHVNVFECIAGMCQDKICGAIVGSTDIFNPDEMMIAIDLMQILKQYNSDVMIPQNLQQNITGVDNLLTAIENAQEKIEIPRYLEKPLKDARKNLKKQLNVFKIVENVCKYINTHITLVVSGSKYYVYNSNSNSNSNSSVWQVDTDNTVFNQIADKMNTAFSGTAEDPAVDFLHPNNDYDVGTDANDASIVTKLTYNGKSILLTGDAPGRLYGSIIRNVDNNGKLLGIGVLVCPHHGSITDGSHLWYGELKESNSNMLSIISSDPNKSNKLPAKWWPDEDVCDIHRIVYHSSDESSKEGDNESSEEGDNINTKSPIFVTAAADVGYHVNIADDGTLKINETEEEMEEETEEEENSSILQQLTRAFFLFLQRITNHFF